MNSKKFFGYWVAVGCAIIGIVNIGMLSTMSIFLPYLAEGTNSPISTIMYVVTSCTLVAVLSSVVLTKMITKIGARACFAIGTFCCALHYVMYATTHSATVVIIAAGIAGVSVSFGSIATGSVLIGEWFIERRTQMLGLVLGVMGLGAGIFIFVAGRLNEYFDGNYRLSYWVLIGIIIILGFGANVLLVRTPEKLGQKPLGWEKEQEEEAKAIAGLETKGGSDKKSDDIQLSGVSFKGTLMSPAFWLIVISTTLLSSSCEALVTFGPTYFIINGESESVVANLASAYLLAMVVVTMLLGFYAARVGNKIFVATVSFAAIASMFTLFIWPSTKSFGILILAALFYTIAAPAQSSMVPTITTEAFGERVYAKISPAMIGAIYLGSAISPIIINTATAYFGDMKYSYSVFAVASAFALIALQVALRIAPMKRIGNKVETLKPKE